MSSRKVRVAAATITLLAAMATGQSRASAACSPQDFPQPGGILYADAVTAAGSELCAAASGPYGDFPWRIRLLNSRGIGDTDGTVYCGTTAWGGPKRAAWQVLISDAANPALIGQYRVVYMLDGGPPPAPGQPSPDKIYGRPPTKDPVDCGGIDTFADFYVRDRDRLRS